MTDAPEPETVVELEAEELTPTRALEMFGELLAGLYRDSVRLTPEGHAKYAEALGVLAGEIKPAANRAQRRRNART